MLTAVVYLSFAVLWLTVALLITAGRMAKLQTLLRRHSAATLDRNRRRLPDYRARWNGSSI